MHLQPQFTKNTEWQTIQENNDIYITVKYNKLLIIPSINATYFNPCYQHSILAINFLKYVYTKTTSIFITGLTNIYQFQENL